MCEVGCEVPSSYNVLVQFCILFPRQAFPPLLGWTLIDLDWKPGPHVELQLDQLPHLQSIGFSENKIFYHYLS